MTAEATDDKWDDSIDGIRQRNAAIEGLIGAAWESNFASREELHHHDLAVEHAARVDVPTLLAEVKRLNAEREAIKAERDDYMRKYYSATTNA